MQYLPRALAGLGSYRQFILCRFIPLPDGRTKKLPIDWRTGDAGNPHDSGTWMSFEDARDTRDFMGDEFHIGFVLTERDPFFLLDIDHCVTPETGELSLIASTLISTLQGAAVERSQGGDGLHVIGQGECPPHSCKNLHLGLELYTEARFIALTGVDTVGDVRTDCSLALPFVVESYFTPDPSGVDDGEWYTEAHPDWDGPENDDLLLAKAMESRSAASAFGGRASFRDLFEANAEVLSAAYPDSGGREYDASSADAALAQHLAFWTGNNHERIKRLMLRSQLRRDKWETRGDYYLPKTIRGAAARQTQFYSANRKDPPLPERPPVQSTAAMGQESSLTTGYQFMSVEEQLNHFRGCVYVRDTHRVFVPDGQFLRSDQFKASYGGYVFAMDSAGTKTSKNAFEVFTESQAVRFPKVHGYLFNPAMPSGAIVQEEGKLYVNTYVPIETERVEGDPRPFVDLVERMLPDPHDQQVILGYMAGLLQYPGVKFQYCPVVQGTEGNGKTTLIRCLEFGVGRRYSHQPNTQELAKSGGKFTAWLDRKLFIGVEEIHVKNEPGGLLDRLKPLLTSERVEHQAKGLDQVMADNVSNWFMLCNRKDDVPVTTDTRRYCIFYTAQQNHDDCLRSGMTDEYWAGLYGWLKQDGYAIVNNYLRQYVIADEYNPALVSRAPKTSATWEAITLTRGELEQQVQDAIDGELAGFRGGWVSSIMLKDYLRTNRLTCRPSKVRALMNSLGYDWHPALSSTRGRSTGQVMAEGSRPILYIRRDHVACNIEESRAVQQAYEKAQGYIAGDTGHAMPPREEVGNG